MTRFATEYFYAPPSYRGNAECLECEPLLFKTWKVTHYFALQTWTALKCRPVPQPVQIYLNIWSWNLVPQNSQFNFIQTPCRAKLRIRISDTKDTQDTRPIVTPVSHSTEGSVYITVITVLGAKVTCNSVHGHLKVTRIVFYIYKCPPLSVGLLWARLHQIKFEDFISIPILLFDPLASRAYAVIFRSISPIHNTDTFPFSLTK
jgi:hypothetical protein